ncbi:hypothetical protein BH09PSE1_BH09PSE1_02920 [soil metagenome]
MKLAAALTGVVLLLCGVVGSAGAEVGRWSVVRDQSSITMSVRAAGLTQTGRFSTWSGDIRFDPETPRTAQVAIEVQAASLTMRQQTMTQRATGPGFLDAAHFPSIRFRLRSLEPVLAGRYMARADVTVKERTRPVEFPVDLSLSNGVARMTGGFVLDRAAYGIGSGGGLNSLIGRDVRVEVALATRQVGS